MFIYLQIGMAMQHSYIFFCVGRNTTEEWGIDYTDTVTQAN